MDYRRILSLKEDSGKRSLFLFGPRQTGKTFLLKKLFPASPFYNLLLADVFLRVSQRPQIIREELLAQKPKNDPVIIDEIQKLPLLLDEVQYLITEKGIRFILTGSSPKKLIRGGANLLGGRAWTRQLFPLVSAEIPGCDLERMLNYGSLPAIYDSTEPEQDMAAYVGSYLKEEIQAEGLARRIDHFSRFLQTASLTNAELVNFANIAGDTQLAPKTVAEYYSILEDTLVGCLLAPFIKTRKRKAMWMIVSHHGDGLRFSGLTDSESKAPLSSFRKISIARHVLIRTAITAFHPKWVSINPVPQFHVPATIRTGGAAK